MFIPLEPLAAVENGHYECKTDGGRTDRKGLKCPVCGKPMDKWVSDEDKK